MGACLVEIVIDSPPGTDPGVVMVDTILVNKALFESDLFEQASFWQGLGKGAHKSQTLLVGLRVPCFQDLVFLNI